MFWLIFGLCLWAGAHFFKRVLPRQREAMGNAGRGLVAALILAGLVSMVIGYRAVEYEHLYTLPGWAWHANNMIMLVAIFLMDVSRVGGVVRSKVRHPMLLGVITWSVAHLLVNGDLASLVLFGGLGLWALAEMAIINHAQGPWSPPPPGFIVKDVKLAIIAIVLYAVIVAVHYWFGYSVIAALE